MILNNLSCFSIHLLLQNFSNTDQVLNPRKKDIFCSIQLLACLYPLFDSLYFSCLYEIVADS